MSKRVLVVDDDEAARKFLSIVLEQNGYAVLTAENGEVGLKKAKEEKPDIIILDIMMPRKNGISTLQDLKSKKELRDIPVIILSSALSFIEQARNEIDNEDIIKEMQGLLDRVDSKIDKFFLRFTSYRKMLLFERERMLEQFRDKDAKIMPYISLPELFMDKPVNPDELLEVLKELLDELK
ncbi:response regulator [Candidatus Magnetomonas plexicatena]|uniref:response regulator n=1 Tax=Candidatus Magnetomonas plexicatena TaxID=2552947 RepID=UPI001102C538|nr:response regulator [Nitrospirales bacterium LBB_01]